MSHFPTCKELKLGARQKLAAALAPCLMAAMTVVMVRFLVSVVLQRSGGAFLLYYWDTATNDIQSTLSLSAEGLFAALRLDEMGVGVSVAITPIMVLTVLGMQLLCAAVTAPVRLGCLHHLWAVHTKQPITPRAVFAPYADPRRSLQSVLLELLLTLIQLILQLIFCLPALYVLQDRGPTLEGFAAAGWTMTLGFLVCWLIMTQFDLARYLLARDEQATALSALRDNFALLRHAGGRLLRFRLSFAILEILTGLTNGVFDMFRFPYQGLATILWLEAREIEQKEDTVCPL